MSEPFFLEICTRGILGQSDPRPCCPFAVSLPYHPSILCCPTVHTHQCPAMHFLTNTTHKKKNIRTSRTSPVDSWGQLLVSSCSPRLARGLCDYTATKELPSEQAQLPAALADIPREHRAHSQGPPHPLPSTATSILLTSPALQGRHRDLG